MTLAPIYYIEPQWEPDGPGNGWSPAPSDDLASVYCVIRREPGAPLGEEAGYESVIASETSRRAAGGVIARLTAARRMEDERPPPTPLQRRSVLVRFLMGLPIVIVIWFVSAVINKAT